MSKRVSTGQLAFGLTIAIAVMVWSCTKDRGVLPVPPTPPVIKNPNPQDSTQPVGPCDTITYTKHIKPIVDIRCISCHQTGLATNNWNFETYSQLKKASDEGILEQVLTGQNGRTLMPYGTSGLPKAELDLMLCWIGNGELQ